MVYHYCHDHEHYMSVLYYVVSNEKLNNTLKKTVSEVVRLGKSTDLVHSHHGKKGNCLSFYSDHLVMGVAEFIEFHTDSFTSFLKCTNVYPNSSG